MVIEQNVTITCWTPSARRAWQCFGLLLNILDICTSHSCSTDTVGYLITLIKEHHILFKEVYPHASITPKMHFLVQQILKFGPVIYSWTTRYESKLKLCKQAAKFGNFKKYLLFRGTETPTMVMLPITGTYISL